MFNFFKTEKDKATQNISIISVACLLIHVAKIDENYSEKEKNIIKESLIKLGAQKEEIDEIIKTAEEEEKNSNQLIEYTKEVKNLNNDKKILLIEALWDIIYSDENADMYETNIIRRLSGLLYLDKKIVGDIKEKIKNRKR
tara:strand:+ start:387 stop:809 length:423 start_codon:yes stop_codon:yes gene_type:complete